MMCKLPFYSFYSLNVTYEVFLRAFVKIIFFWKAETDFQATGPLS